MANNFSAFLIHTNFITLFLLLLHLGCFFLFTSSKQPPPSKKRRKIAPLPDNNNNSSSPKHKLYSLSFIKRIFSFSTTIHHPCKSDTTIDQNPSPDNEGPTTSSASISSTTILTTTKNLLEPSNISSDDYFHFPLRNDIFPCPSCGEVFNTPPLLDRHVSTKHAVSELIDGQNSGKNIVRIIFNTGWNPNPNPKIIRILKIHNSPKILSRFEEYRENVKSKAARNSVARRRNERCVADGNELLRFHCTTFLCDLGQYGNSSICNGQYCSVCGIVRSGFSPKMDGISTMSSSWRAHVAVPGEIEEEFGFMNVKRAMLVCRVIAGRVGRSEDEVDKTGFDSVVGGGGQGVAFAGVHRDEDELLVFNPRAVLPCFVIVYIV